MEVLFCDISNVNINDINLSLISEERVIKANRYNDDIKKIQSLVAYLLLRYSFSNKDIDLLKHEFTYNEFSKPMISGLDYDFNITHSNKIVAVVINEDNVGLDLEMIDYNKDLSKLQKVLTKEEIQVFDNLDNAEKQEYFYRTWVMKEAHFKMLGIGYQKNFNHTNLDYQVELLCDDLGNRYFISATNNFNLIKVKFNEINK